MEQVEKSQGLLNLPKACLPKLHFCHGKEFKLMKKIPSDCFLKYNYQAASFAKGQESRVRQEFTNSRKSTLCGGKQTAPLHHALAAAGI